MDISHTIEEGVSNVTLFAPNGHRVECLMTQYEPYVYDTMCDFLPDGAHAAEIGSFRGGSACILADGMARRGKRLDLAAHDVFEPYCVGSETVDVEREFDASIRAFDVRVNKVKGDSKVTHSIHADASLDYVFIDGDHSYEGATADIANFTKKLRPDGWLVMQDSIREVAKAIEDAGLPLHMAMINPPFGHYVTVCHADHSRLVEFLERLEAKMEQVIASQGQKSS
jgi:hypothetical protein